MRMRVFYAVLLPESIRDSLCGAIELLRQASLKGRFTRRENLHLTLAFLGEVPPERIDTLSEIMGSISVQAFPLRFGNLDRFRKKGRDIWWVGVEHSDPLDTVYHELAASLKRSGFLFDDLPYVPHLTLGREILTAPGFDRDSAAAAIPPMRMVADRLSLMQSSRMNGMLTYSELRWRMLAETEGQAPAKRII
jgi:RNA 2',3'-cyclic 3'-phosphodiesterase